MVLVNYCLIQDILLYIYLVATYTIIHLLVKAAISFENGLDDLRNSQNSITKS